MSRQTRRLADATVVEGSRISAHVPGTGVTGPISLVLTVGIGERTVTDTYESMLTP